MSGMFAERPGDATRRRADAKAQVLAFIEQQQHGRLFCAADVARDTSVSFDAAISQLDALARKGVLVQIDKRGDSRRHWARARGGK